MRRSRKVLAVALLVLMGLSLTATMANASAADAFANFSSARIASACFEARDSTVCVTGWDGTGIGNGPGGVYREEWGCVSIYPKDVWILDVASAESSSIGGYEGGCGPLDVDIDPTLSRARVKGTIQTDRYNPETYEWEPSSVRVDMSWRGRGNLTPFVNHSESVGADPDRQSGYVSFGFDLGSGRTAVAKGSVVSETQGTFEGSTDTGYIFGGTNVFVNTYA